MWINGYIIFYMKLKIYKLYLYKSNDGWTMISVDIIQLEKPWATQILKALLGHHHSL